MTTATSTPRGHHPLSWSLSPPTFAGAWRHQWSWLVSGIALSFLIPFVLTDLMTIDRDLYYGVYVGSVLAFGLWLRFGTDSPRALLTHNWRRGIVLGAAFIGVMVAVVLKDTSTAHPHGLDFAAAIVWRGVVYGFTDGVLLSAFPILAVFSAFAGKRILERRLGKIAIGALALAVSLLFTAVYHLGYSDFRGEKIRKPLLGDAMWSVPTLVTLSPIASPITHAGLHVSAVIHSYDTDTFLPPHSNASSATQRITAATTAFAPARQATVKIFVTRGAVGLTCTRVVPLERKVAKPAVLRGAVRALIAGPTAAERGHGYGGWFSARTANSLRSVHVAGGVAYIDFRDFSRVIPNASSSCGSALLLAQLDRTVTQFPSVKRAVYSFNGNRRAFYEWLQREAPALEA